MNNKLKVNEQLVCRKNQYGTVILMRMDESSNFYKITGVATEVWEKLQNKVSLENIYTELSEKYSVSKKQIIEDTENFIADLVKYGMVTYN